MTGAPARGLRGPAPTSPRLAKVASRSRLISGREFGEFGAGDRLKIGDRRQTRACMSLNGADSGAPAAARMKRSEFLPGLQPPAAGDEGDLVGTRAQFLADVVDQASMATFSPTTRASDFARHGLGRREQDRFDAAHVFAPAQVCGHLVELGVVEFGFRRRAMSEPVQPECGTPGELARGAERDQPIAKASHAAIGHAAEARRGGDRVIIEQGRHDRAGTFRAQSRRVAIKRRGASREFAMEVDGRGGGSRVGDRHAAEFVPAGPRRPPPPGRRQARAAGSASRSRYARTAIGEPEAQKFRAGMMAPDIGQHMRGRSQRRSFFAARRLRRHAAMSVSASVILSPKDAATWSSTAR